MNITPEQLAALLMVIADLRLMIAQLQVQIASSAVDD